jgi:hypothetical protein
LNFEVADVGSKCFNPGMPRMNFRISHGNSNVPNLPNEKLQTMTSS